MGEGDGRHRAELARRLRHPGQLVFRIMAGDEAAGWLWLAVPGPDPDRLMAWVYNIEVDPAFRGRGYGRAAMILAEGEARSRGMTSLGLNVHGHNTVARRSTTASATTSRRCR